MSYITHDSCMLAISTALFHLERDPGHDTSYVTPLASRPFVPQVWCIRFLKYVRYAFDNNYEPYVSSYVLHHRIIYPYIRYLCGNVTQTRNDTHVKPTISTAMSADNQTDSPKVKPMIKWQRADNKATLILIKRVKIWTLLDQIDQIGNKSAMI